MTTGRYWYYFIYLLIFIDMRLYCPGLFTCLPINMQQFIFAHSFDTFPGYLISVDTLRILSTIHVRGFTFSHFSTWCIQRLLEYHNNTAWEQQRVESDGVLLLSILTRDLGGRGRCRCSCSCDHVCDGCIYVRRIGPSNPHLNVST